MHQPVDPEGFDEERVLGLVRACPQMLDSTPLAAWVLDAIFAGEEETNEHER